MHVGWRRALDMSTPHTRLPRGCWGRAGVVGEGLNVQQAPCKHAASERAPEARGKGGAATAGGALWLLAWRLRNWATTDAQLSRMQCYARRRSTQQASRPRPSDAARLAHLWRRRRTERAAQSRCRGRIVLSAAVSCLAYVSVVAAAVCCCLCCASSARRPRRRPPSAPSQPG